MQINGIAFVSVMDPCSSLLVPVAARVRAQTSSSAQPDSTWPSFPGASAGRRTPCIYHLIQVFLRIYIYIYITSYLNKLQYRSDQVYNFVLLWLMH